MSREKLIRIQELIIEEKAIEARKIFKSIEPEESAIWYFTKGVLEQKFQNWGEAINAFSSVLEIDPNNSDAKNNLHMVRNILNFWNPEMFNP